MDGDWDRPCERSRRQWTVIENHSNPLDELVRLYADMAIARARVEEALQELARRHRIRSDRVVMAMESHADGLLNAVVGQIKSRLSSDLEVQSDPDRRATTIREIRIAKFALPATEASTACPMPGSGTGTVVINR